MTRTCLKKHVSKHLLGLHRLRKQAVFASAPINTNIKISRHSGHCDGKET